MAEIKKWENNTVRVQEKGFRFVVLNNDHYVRKVEDQIGRSYFLQLDHNPTQKLDFKIKKWLGGWTKNISFDDKWQSYLKPTNASISGKMYGLIKTHKVGNPTRVITSECSTTIEKIIYICRNSFIWLANEFPSHIRDTGHILNIVDEFNRSNLPSESILFGFGIKNTFPSNDNNFGNFLESFRIMCKYVSTNWICYWALIEVIELCLTCNNSIFNNENYLQILHCSY